MKKQVKHIAFFKFKADRTPAQVEQVHFAVVMEYDPIFERRLDRRPGFQLHVVEHRIHVT